MAAAAAPRTHGYSVLKTDMHGLDDLYFDDSESTSALSEATSFVNGRKGRTNRLRNEGSCSRKRRTQPSAALVQLAQAIAIDRSDNYRNVLHRCEEPATEV